jgi:hypothetical protein
MTSDWMPKKQFVAEVACEAGISFRAATSRVYHRTNVPVPAYEERRKNQRVVEVRLLPSQPVQNGFILHRRAPSQPSGRTALKRAFWRIMQRRSFKLHLVERDFAARLGYSTTPRG